jgi:hypothetical protein
VILCGRLERQEGKKEMKTNKTAWILVLTTLALAPAARAQENTQPTQTAAEADTTSDSDVQKNIQEYIELMRSDVKQRKAETLATVMQLSAADAAKFWPIYGEYDVELTKLNDLRVTNIQEYANAYDQMTDEKADELIRKALAYRKQRQELVAKYYERVKQALGATTAARFFQIEDQLLSIIDLQIDSSLPIVGKSS